MLTVGDESRNISIDIDAMIRTKRSELERADAVHQEKIRTLVMLIPIVCDSGNRSASKKLNFQIEKEFPESINLKSVLNKPALLMIN